MPAKITKSKLAKYGACDYSENKIRKILENPIYAGYVFLRRKDGSKELFKGRHEAIISQELWDNAQVRIAETKGKIDHTGIRIRTPYLLKKKLFCSCGAHMTVGSCGKKHSDGSAYGYYICTHKIHERSNCSCKTSISQRILDAVVLSALAYIGANELKMSDVKSSTEKYKNDLIAEEESLTRKKNALARELQRSTERFASLSDDMARIAEKVLNEKSRELAEMERRLSQISSELDVLNEDFDMGDTQIKASLSSLEGLHAEMTLDEKQALVNAVIENATLIFEKEKGFKKFFKLKISPKPEYLEKVGHLEISFEVDNSLGRGLWEITAPFNLKCAPDRNLPSKNSSEYGRHFIHRVIKNVKSIEAHDYTIREAAEALGIKRGMLGREITMYKRLSQDALDFLIKIKRKVVAEKLTFVRVERVSKMQKHQQLIQLKKLVLS